ncbi:hypothetical protein GIY56_05365 [Paracoccus sp. YIM 132242]|uniref:Uncharacterized protein n=1 Tax=Paracoccus lichenicola TaxID=2665644 RepID=A0A6L6HMM6_9RHOB|nr:hypothetical protein [Paracoccus lichenicola]MTD99708.1 hypothetical protein [Paracoccus lichenicola]
MSETDFDDWLQAEYAETQGFTVLIVLLGLGGGRVDLLKSAHLHVIGDEIHWPDMAGYLDGSGMAWDAVALFRAGREGLVADDVARDRLDQLVRALNGDRTLIREAAFFNRDGLRLRLDDAEPQPPVLN